MPYNPNNPNVIERGGKYYTWVPDPMIAEYAAHNGIDEAEAARQLGRDPSQGGSWEEGSYAHEGGQLGKVLGILALAGAGGGLASAYLPALFGAGAAGTGGGAAGATAAGTGATTAAGTGAATAAGTGGGIAAGTGGGIAAGTGAAAGGTAATAGGLGGLLGGGGVLGTGLTVLDLIGKGGQIANSISAGRANDRYLQSQYNLDYDEQERSRIDTISRQAVADIQQRQYADKANAQAQQQRYAANWMRAPNAVTTRPPGVPTTTSNYGPEMMPNRMATADDLERQAMIRILNPIKAGSGDDTLPTLPEMPELSRTDLGSSKLDTFLNYLGYGGGIAATINQNRRPSTPTTTPPPMSAGRTVPSYLTDPRDGYQLPYAPGSLPPVGRNVPFGLFDNTSTPLPYVPRARTPEEFGYGADPRTRRPSQPAPGSGGRMTPSLY